MVVVAVAVIGRCLGEEGVYATARMRNEVSIGNIFFLYYEIFPEVRFAKISL